MSNMEKYTKKASARILKEVLKVNPKVSGFTTFDQAFVILMDHWDMELAVENCENHTNCILYRDGDKVYNWDLENLWDEKIGDWDWNTIYKTILEDIVKQKLYKRPKLGKRALKKLEEEKNKKATESEEIDTKATFTKTEKSVSIIDLRKKRDNLSAKIYDWKKKGKDITELSKELDKIKENIKLAKTK